MTLRPPQALAPARNNDGPLNAALEHEILAEKAATYGRLVRRLEESLAPLAGYEADTLPLTASSPGRGPASPPPRGRPDRRRAFALASLRSDAGQSGKTEYEALLDTAGEALWYVMIQRDICGFRNHELFCRQLGVPAAVRLRMGPVRA